MDKLYESFELPTLKDKIEANSNPNQMTCNLQPPMLPFKTSSKLNAAINKTPKDAASQQHEHLFNCNVKFSRVALPSVSEKMNKLIAN